MVGEDATVIRLLHFCVIPLPTCKHLSHQTFSFMPYFKDTQQGPKKSLQK